MKARRQRRLGDRGLGWTDVGATALGMLAAASFSLLTSACIADAQGTASSNEGSSGLVPASKPSADNSSSGGSSSPGPDKTASSNNPLGSPYPSPWQPNTNPDPGSDNEGVTAASPQPSPWVTPSADLTQAEMSAEQTTTESEVAAPVPGRNRGQE
jgi:hypothetical protein